MLILRSIQKPLKILCARELQNSIKDSVLSLLKDQIYAMGLEDHFEIGINYLKGNNGTEFIFRGLRTNAAEIKSMEGVDIAWIEEAQGVSTESWKLLRPTVRKEGSEIWVTFNPLRATDPTYRLLIAKPPENTKVALINYTDNPWMTTALIAEMEDCKKNDPDMFPHIWEGQCISQSAMQLIGYEWVTDARESELEPDGSLPELRVSVDVADGGTDSTIITVARKYDSHMELIIQVPFKFKTVESPIRAAEAAIELWEEYGGDADNGDTFVVDCLGVGSGTGGILLKGGYPVIIYKGGKASDNKDEWRNRRVQSYLAMRNDFRDGRVKIADGFTDAYDWDEFISQMCMVRRNPNSDKVEDIETKERLKAREGLSPDRADSTAMLWSTEVPNDLSDNDWSMGSVDSAVA